ncbi:MAG: hypothetical protein Q8N15_00295, partial [Bacillota bacterium]|nr:hypothetical protein [Bacillota bacterium]
MLASRTKMAMKILALFLFVAGIMSIVACKNVDTTTQITTLSTAAATTTTAHVTTTTAHATTTIAPVTTT